MLDDTSRELGQGHIGSFGGGLVWVWVWFWFCQGIRDTPGTRYVDQAGLELQRSACLVLLNVGIKGMATMPGFINFFITLIVHGIFVLCLWGQSTIYSVGSLLPPWGPRD